MTPTFNSPLPPQVPSTGSALISQTQGEQYRYPPVTSSGQKQCANCGEIDTPQWRGVLCNACSLWKRSRGSDRPVPLRFPVTKRPRSPDDTSRPEGVDRQVERVGRQVEGVNEQCGGVGAEDKEAGRGEGAMETGLVRDVPKEVGGPALPDPLKTCMVCGQRYIGPALDTAPLCAICLYNKVRV